MRVVYFTRPCFLDLAISHARELSKLVELHFILELSPESWRSSIFDLEKLELNSGVMDGSAVFEKHYPKLYGKYLSGCASIALVVHSSTRSTHPSSWKISLEAMSYCLQLQPDLMHFDEVSLRTAWGMWRLRSTPVVFSIHDPVAHSGEKDWRKDLARKLSFPYVDRFLVHSVSMKGLLLRSSKSISDAMICHNLLGAYDIFREWIDRPVIDDDKTILFFGRLSPYKGIEILYEAAPLIAEKISGLKIMVAGRPIPGYQLPNIPELPNGGQFVVINSYIDNQRLAKLFQESTLVVCPYLDATQSGVILTAYAFDKPVLASDTGGLPEYVWPGQTGCLVRPGDAQQLAEAVVQTLDNKELREHFKLGIESIKKSTLSWSNIANRTVSIYTKLLTG